MKKNYIIIPTYNDWKSLNKVLRLLDENLKNSTNSINIIIVNDCSSQNFKLKKKKFKNINSLKIINLKENVGSQKAIFIGLKYLQKKIKLNNSQDIISVLDSDGEDNPKMLKKLIELAIQKKDYFIFASRKERTEGIFFKLANKIRLYISFILTGKFINFGNYSSFPSVVLKKILLNNNLYLAYSSGVLKNYKKIFLFDIKKNKRYFGHSKVNFKFLINHSIMIISVFYKVVFFRTLVISLILLLYLTNLYLKIFLIFVFIIFNLILLILNKFSKPKGNNLNIIKNIKLIFRS
jgi:polyisoprenyl-phosphate glycosyltransferase